MDLLGHSPDLADTPRRSVGQHEAGSVVAKGTTHGADALLAMISQQAAQLPAMDVPMLDDLLPLTDLHDPFLDAGWHHASHEPVAQAVTGNTVAGALAVGFAEQPWSLPPAPYFSGIPAYAEPESPPAHLINSSVAVGLGFGHTLNDCAAHAVHPQGQTGEVGSSGGSPLPPAIAAAQQLAAARAFVDHAVSGAGSSHISNSSKTSAAEGGLAAAGSAGGTPTASPTAGRGAAPLLASSSGISEVPEDGDILEGVVENAPLSPASPAIRALHGPGAPADGQPTPVKRGGGRPREKKSYDSLIDPGLPLDEVRRLRRVLSNRESARRSRRRRQTQVHTLESEVQSLKSDNLRLERELSRAAQCATQLAADKAALLAEVEALRGQLGRVSTGGFAPPAASPHPPTPVSHFETTLGRRAVRQSNLPPAIELAQCMADRLAVPSL